MVKVLQEFKQKIWKEQELHRQEKEEKQGQTQQEVHHAHIDEIPPIQVVDSFEQQAKSKQGEQSQDQDFAQEIEQILEQMDTEMEEPESKKDIDLMPYN